MFTEFWDMHTGGYNKIEPYNRIYIEADVEEAVEIFKSRFGIDPERCSCRCCGQDYSIEGYETLEKATQYSRGGCCDYEPMFTFEEFIAREDVLVLRAADIQS